ncbi:MAG: hypothetical protein KC729_05575, partial [Candidatus Eisenbacteria bacterium]|nr:hypothetical protein [Candidatus Eisenbacteria bacterium]
DLPRIGLLHTWTETQSCGWVRYALDAQKVPYTLLRPEDVQKNALNEIDVLLFPTRESNLTDMLQGIDPAFGPLAYTTTREYPSHGVPDGSDDITGGIGYLGMEKIARFLEEGGVLLATANGGILAVDGGLVRRVRRVTGVQTPGSELVAHVEQPRSPLAYGYPEWTSVFRGNTALFDVRKPERARVVLQFGTERKDETRTTDEAGTMEETPETVTTSVSLDVGGTGSAELAISDSETAARNDAPKSILLSGRLEDPAAIDGKPAILDLPVGSGRVVLYAFEPLHRYLNHSDFRWLWNGILNWNDLAG